MTRPKDFSLKQTIALAKKAVKKGDIENAQKLYNTVIQLYPNHTAAKKGLKKIHNILSSKSSGRSGSVNPSQDQMNILLNLYKSGQVAKAERYCKELLQTSLHSFVLFNYLGAIYRAQGKLNEAIQAFDNAIRLKPDFAEAYSNKGNALTDLGDFDEAVRSYNKATQVRPSYAEAYHNSGNALFSLGRIKESMKKYEKAIKIRTDYSEAVRSMALLMKDPGNQFNFDVSFKQTLLFLFQRDDINHNDIVHTAIAFIISQYNIEPICRDMNSHESVFEEKRVQSLLKDDLFNLILQKALVTSEHFEFLLSKIRQTILFLYFSDNPVELKEFSKLIISLSEQCFLNEYIYPETSKEKELISILQANSETNDTVDELALAILGCYVPLCSNSEISRQLQDYRSNTTLFNDLIQLQVVEPAKEKELSNSIPVLSELSDEVSKKVQNQYEEHPYPRWRYTYTKRSANVVQIINNEIKPNKIKFDNQLSSPEVLIAGCGTGKHIIKANDYKNAKILGIDLSLTSLSYSKRKTDAFGLKNINYCLADILNLNQLDRQFDIIESIGVLHHMKDPIKGFSMLVSLLKPHGYMKIGLYSSLARTHIHEARNFIKNKRFKNTLSDIRRCRQAIFESKDNKLLYKVTQSKDFYSTSDTRDLIFHVQEHCFMLPQLIKILDDLNLQFLGFAGISSLVKQLFSEKFPNDKTQTSLECWHDFETMHPDTFSGMYNFWVKKR